MACAISASMLGRRPAVKLGAGLSPSLAATDWKAVTEMLCDLFLGSYMHNGLKSCVHNKYEDSQHPSSAIGLMHTVHNRQSQHRSQQRSPKQNGDSVECLLPMAGCT